jgi:hypothetical protein
MPLGQIENPLLHGNLLGFKLQFAAAQFDSVRFTALSLRPLAAEMSAIFVVDFALSAVAILSANRAVQIMDTVLGVKVLRDIATLADRCVLADMLAHGLSLDLIDPTFAVGVGYGVNSWFSRHTPL